MRSKRGESSLGVIMQLLTRRPRKVDEGRTSGKGREFSY